MFGAMDEDVQQRDFTLTALYYAPLKEQVIDYVNGVEGIKKEISIWKISRILSERYMI